ncbi:MAG: sulfatase-like hydrolase/transferase [Planctomycetaceae bacterium]|nr:sulfatase-like hydrolase/transferase [Planctomycetaceae bacterium]
MKRYFVPNLVLFFLAAFALPVYAEKHCNVLFIAVDDLRPDLGCYGVTHAQSPHIDRLAARGVVFERAYCQQAVCSPSRSSILTGLRPDATKVWDLDTHFRVAQPTCVTLPQFFRTNGYHTVGLGKIEHHGFEDGLSWSEPRWYASGQMVRVDPVDWTKRTTTSFAGVEREYTQPIARAEGKNSTKKGPKGPAFEVSPKQDDELPDGATAAEAVARIRKLKHKEQPFFLAVGFVKPHLPFVAPKKYWDLHDPAAIPLPATDKLPQGTADFVGHNNSELHSYVGVPKENPIPAEYAKQLRHGYHACISYMDAQVGRLLAALDEEGLAENTIVVLWGDHGWQLGDHGLWHKHTNFEVAARAPLLICPPRGSARGGKCAAPVEFVDVYPTLVDLCGLTQPAGLAGMSLKRYLDDPNAAMQKPAISQYHRSSKEHGGALMGYSVRTERWRGTFWRKRNGAEIGYTELYDDLNDPAETVNLADKPEHAALLASLKNYLPPVGSDAPSPQVAEPASQPQPAKASTTTDETREQRFDRLYPGKAKLSLDEYLAAQKGDQAAAKARFKNLDKNQDGVISRDEFIKTGK